MFKKAFYKGFKLSNYYDNFGTIEEKILKQEFILQKYKNNNFFFFNRVDNLLYYFINDLQNFNLKANYIKILTKTDKQLLQHNDFLKLNHFKEILNHKQMILKKDEIKLKNLPLSLKLHMKIARKFIAFLENILIHICFIFHKKS